MSVRRTGTRALRTAERDAQIYALRLAGFRRSEIARRVGCHESTVGRALVRRLQKYDDDVAEMRPAVRRLELDRLDALIASVWQLATEPFDEDGLDDKLAAICDAIADDPTSGAVRSACGDLLDGVLRARAAQGSAIDRVLRCVGLRAQIAGLRQPQDPTAAISNEICRELAEAGRPDLLERILDGHDMIAVWGEYRESLSIETIETEVSK